MPSAWLISVPRASAMKQEKSWLWLKIGERAVRVITQPIWCEMWSSRFCTSARRDRDRASWRRLRHVNQEIVARIDLEQVARADEGGGGALLDQQRAGELAAGAQSSPS